LEIDLTILGNSSASPTRDRNQSGQYLKMGKCHILIDCGEGTQSRLLKYGLSYQRIDIILISHLHGDHYLGMFGLLNTMSLNGRKNDLIICAPKELKELIELHFAISNSRLTFNIQYIDLGADETFLENEKIQIQSFAVKHRIPCFAFLINELNVRRKLNIDVCEKLQIHQKYFNKLKDGEDLILENGTIIKNERVTFDPEPAFSYGYVTDTLFLEELCSNFLGVQVLYHEATFLDNLIDRAKMAYHSTAAQAGRFALKAFVSQLVIGHFSSRYTDLNDHLEEARSVFPNTELAIEGKCFQFK